MTINWSEVFKRYQGLDNGSKALIKRAKELDEIKLSTTLFQLGVDFNTQSCRVAYCLPFLNAVKDGNSLGKAIGILDDGDIGNKDKYSTIGKRLMRVVRLDSADDLYEFRRLLNYIAGKTANKTIDVDIDSTCKTLYFWGEMNKKQMFENYLIEKYNRKESKKENSDEQ